MNTEQSEPSPEQSEPSPIKQDRERVGFIFVVLVLAWLCFVWLVRQNSVESTAALIMTWASVGILVVAVFPKILDRIKRIKVGDYLEIELQEAVKQAVNRSSINASDLISDFVIDEKRSADRLNTILARSELYPYEPILLVVNTKKSTSISPSLLFTYAFFLDIFSISVTLIFIDTPKNIDRLTDVTTKSIIGVTSGKKTLLTFYKRFPTLYRIFDYPISQGRSNNNDNIARIPSRRQIEDFSQLVKQEMFRSADFYPSASGENTNLSQREIAEWFRNVLDTKRVSTSLLAGDIEIIRSALEDDDDYVLVLDGEKLTSVITVCQLSTRLTRRILAN